MDGFKYADMVAECANPRPCKYGHLGCALVKGGPCMDEELGNAEAAALAARDPARGAGGRYADELPEADFYGESE